MVHYQGDAGLIKWAAKNFLLLCFLEEFVWDWYYFFIKCFKEFTIYHLGWHFLFFVLWGEILNCEFSLLIDIEILRYFIFSWGSSSNLRLLRIHLFHLGCQIYWHKVVNIFLYYPFIVHNICSNAPLFIPDISNLCLVFFPW